MNGNVDATGVDDVSRESRPETTNVEKNAPTDVEGNRTTGPTGTTGSDTELKTFGEYAICGLLVLFILGTVGLGATKVIVGSKSTASCTMEPMICIYLMVSGVVPLMYSGSQSGEYTPTNGPTRRWIIGRVLAVLGFVFYFIWLICGSIWIFSAYSQIVVKELPPCSYYVTSDCTDGPCDPVFVQFSVAMVILDWIFFIPVVCSVGYLAVDKLRDVLK